MKRITRDQINNFAKDVCTFLEANNIPYLLYGSFAYNLLTGEEESVNDLDFIVKESDFPLLIQKLSSLQVNPIETPFSIHANSTEYLGEDQKPFDISFDSYDHYFKPLNIDLNVNQSIDHEDYSIKILPIDKLTTLYEIGLKGSNKNKFESYQRKINKLRFFTKDKE